MCFLFSWRLPSTLPRTDVGFNSKQPVSFLQELKTELVLSGKNTVPHSSARFWKEPAVAHSVLKKKPVSAERGQLGLSPPRILANVSSYEAELAQGGVLPWLAKTTCPRAEQSSFIGRAQLDRSEFEEGVKRATSEGKAQLLWLVFLQRKLSPQMEAGQQNNS